MCERLFFFFSKLERRCQDEKSQKDKLNATYLDLVEKQRAYYKTVKDFQEVTVVTVTLQVFVYSDSVAPILGVQQE